MRWGSGSLQEIDHLPFVGPRQVSGDRQGDGRDRRATAPRRSTSRWPHPPARPSSTIRSTSSSTEADVRRLSRRTPGLRAAGDLADGVEEAAKLLADAERPAIMAGTGLYWARGEERASRARRGPRHTRLPQRHGPRLPARRPRARLLAAPAARAQGGATSRSRSACRSTSGSASAARSARTTKLIWLDSAPNELERNRRPTSSWSATSPPTLGRDREAARRRRPERTAAWVEAVRATEEREARRRAGGLRRRARAASPDAHLRRSSPRCSTATRS